ncbi:MAG TPA: hypothetical protein PLS63_07340 [Microthrixaceae bacterium]|jgi:hypothetical protein|nr:hypothetical protein [Microthrixaceae bacterium]
MSPSTTTHRSSRPHRALRTSVAVAAAGLVLLAAGCSDDSSADPDSRPSTTAASSSTTAAGGAGHDHVEVTAVDFSFEDLPSTIPAGTRLSLRNNAPRELHELVAFHLPADESRPVAELLKLPEAELTALLGAPSTVLLAPPGGDQIPAVGDGTLTDPGRYLVMCSIPTGVDPAEYLKAAAAAKGQKPDVNGGPPHFTSGMFAELTVQ